MGKESVSSASQGCGCPGVFGLSASVTEQWQIQVGSEGPTDPPFPVAVICSYVDCASHTQEHKVL